MNETIDYYNQNADSFIEKTLQADMSDCRDRFLKYLVPGGRILDAGCGSGRDSLAFLELGYQLDAFDASKEICRLATELLGFPVECKRFEDLSGESVYDGIWACASLLHVKEENLDDVVKRLRKLLKPNGILYASFKLGEGERIHNGRFFHDMTCDRCRQLFEGAGFKVLELFVSGDVREDHQGEKWVNFVGTTKIGDAICEY